MSAALDLSEAVPLGYAVLARVADDVGVRVLGIKGPVLALQGLREPRSSADVDVWVEPAGLRTLTDALERLGWHDGGFYDTPVIVPMHSVNHRHPAWPCELDVHHYFPGFLADPSEVFDVLWERRTSVELAHRTIEVPDPTAHAAIAALHYLRDAGRGTRRGELAGLVERLRARPTPFASDMARLAAETGASEPLAPLLTSLGVTPTAATRPLVFSIDDWRLRTRAEVETGLSWVVGLSRTPWRRRPAFLWRGVFLDARQFRVPGETRVPRGRELAVARWRRIRRGVRALPAAVKGYRSLRRGGRDREG